MGIINVRLTGAAASIDAMVESLRELPGVDRAEEKGAVGVPLRRDDASSAGLPDDTASDVREVELHASGDAALESIRDRLEIAARDADAVVEWVEPF